MKLIVDENLHQFTIDLLNNYGFSILTIDEILFWGALDEEIYQYAELNNIPVITHDRRFGQFHYESSDKPPTTIVLQVITPHLHCEFSMRYRKAISRNYYSDRGNI